MERTTTERTRLVVQLENALERPMIALSILWVGIVVIELVRGESRGLTILGYTIWAIFGIDFALKLALVPRRWPFLRRNWATVLSLVFPAFRLLRVTRLLRAARFARLTRGFRAAKLLGGVNRGLHALRRAFRRRGVGYVAAATTVVLFAGAAGMSAFERGAGAPVFAGYPSSLWWTAMLLTSLGSEEWPQTVAGRWLALAIGIYGFTVFGYLTATLASFFVDRDRHRMPAPAGVSPGELGRELRSLRLEIRELRRMLPPASPPPDRGP